MTIRRHPIAPDDIRVRYETTMGNIPLFLKGARENPNNLTLLASNALDITSGGSILAPESPEPTRWLEVAGQAYAALFTVAAAPGGVVEVPLGEGPPIAYQRRPDPSLVHATRWIRGFTIATISRDIAALDALCAVPLDLLRASSTGCHPYVFAMVDAFRAFWLREPDADRRRLDAMAATDPDANEFHNPSHVLRIDVPLIGLLFYVHRRDPDFEKGLVSALENHRAYWGGSPSRRRDWDGFLAFGPLAMATLAQIREIPFEVDSGYLPMSLVRGDHLS